MKLTFEFEWISKSDAIGRFLHNNRTKGHYESNLKIDGIKGGIDETRTFENYSLVKSIHPVTWEKENIANEKIIGGLQKHSKTYTSWVIQAGSEKQTLEPLQQKLYFGSALKWMQNRFGKENIVQAIVHNDEATPHLQIIIANRVKVDKGIYLSAGKSFGLVGKNKIEQKEHLRAMQMTFWSEVASGFDIEKPIEQSKETKKEHLREIDFKRQQIASDILKNQNILIEIRNVMQKVELSKMRSMNYLNSRKSEALLSEIETIMTQDNNQKYFKKAKEQAIKKIAKMTNILER